MSYQWCPPPEGCIWDHNFQFWIDIAPMPWKRPIPALTKYSKKLYEYNDKRMLAQQEQIRQIFYEYVNLNGRYYDYPWHGVATINVQSFFKRPAKYRKKPFPCKLRKDVDNLGKMIMDALQCIYKVRLTKPDKVTGKKSRQARRFGAWDNDDIVVDLKTGKHWAPLDRPNQVGTFVSIDFYVEEFPDEYSIPAPKSELVSGIELIPFHPTKPVSKPGRLSFL